LRKHGGCSKSHPLKRKDQKEPPDPEPAPLHAPSRHSLSLLLRELMCGRPAIQQKWLESEAVRLETIGCERDLALQCDWPALRVELENRPRCTGEPVQEKP
jgi:hypothetical protein